jgi:hypothetical protein
LDSSTAGTKTGPISFTNNDSNENPFNFQISGAVSAQSLSTIGLFNPDASTFWLRNSNSMGTADTIFGFGPAGQRAYTTP